MKKIKFLVLLSAMLLAACGNNNKAEVTTAKDESLKAEDVAEYVATFKRQQEDVLLEFGGNTSELNFSGIDTETSKLSLEFGNESAAGVLTIDVDLKTRQPTGPIAFELFPEESSEEIAEISTQSQDTDVADDEGTLPNTKLVIGSNTGFVKNGENFIFTGSASNQASGEQFDYRFVFNFSLVSKGSAEFILRPELNIAIINGDLGISSYIKMKKMIADFPQITQLLLADISGSSDDNINVYTGRLVREAGLTTVVPETGDIASGGVDLFLAGKERVYYRGGKVGVHSWCCSAGKPANELPKDSPAHNSLIKYSQEMLGDVLGKKFYFYTLAASPFTTVHNMTEQELLEYIVPEITISLVEAVDVELTPTAQ